MCYEDRMIAPGRLLAVVRGLGGRESFFYEVGGVSEHHIHPFACKIIPLLLL